MKRYSKVIYIALLASLSLVLFATYIPGLESAGTFVTPPVALFLGLAFAVFCGEAYPRFNKRFSKLLLQYSVVGLGFGMNIEASLESGREGMIATVVSVFGTLAIGWFFGRKLLKNNRNISYLVSSGTAICGGSAIAAVGPVIKAKDSEMSVALGTVFILNAVALFIFPPIGRMLGLDDVQFGTWAEIAIHDTSSVVGAGAAYSEAALEIATTIKLTRALWIIPVAFVTAVLFRSTGNKITVPWFILWFVIAMLINTYLLDGVPMIGASLSPTVIRQVGLRPLLQGVLLWVVISIVSLLLIIR